LKDFDNLEFSRKSRHQYLKFGTKANEIQKNLPKKYISLQLGVKPKKAPLFVPN
jgi:hypothetical protein